jgi:hypothetical protein
MTYVLIEKNHIVLLIALRLGVCSALGFIICW